MSEQVLKPFSELSLTTQRSIRMKLVNTMRKTKSDYVAWCIEFLNFSPELKLIFIDSYLTKKINADNYYINILKDFTDSYRKSSLLSYQINTYKADFILGEMGLSLSKNRLCIVNKKRLSQIEKYKVDINELKKVSNNEIYLEVLSERERYITLFKAFIMMGFNRKKRLFTLHYEKKDIDVSCLFDSKIKANMIKNVF